MSSEDFRKLIGDELNQFATTTVDPELWHWLSRRIYYVSGNVDDPKSYEKLKIQLAAVDQEHGTRGNYFYYLATSPELFSKVVRHLGNADLTKEETGWRRVIIEKPFGRDYDSARRLNQEVREVLAENQIYRIDHYLGKETVQNILVFRFSNGIFEPILESPVYRPHSDHRFGNRGRGASAAVITITSGTLRDMVPNHIFQLICLTAMEPPVSFDANVVRDEQAKILRAIQPMTPEDVLSPHGARPSMR